jgi:hypothetical protein
MKNSLSESLWGLWINDSSPIQKASELCQAIAKDTGMGGHVRLPQSAREALEQFPIAMNEMKGIQHETISIYRL